MHKGEIDHFPTMMNNKQNRISTLTQKIRDLQNQITQKDLEMKKSKLDQKQAENKIEFPIDDGYQAYKIAH